MAEHKGVMVYCEVSNGSLTAITTELLGGGSLLAKDLQQELYAVLVGNNVGHLATEAVAYGADKVCVIDDPQLDDYLTESYLQSMEEVVNHVMPLILLLGQTQTGRDLAPRLASRLNTGAIMDCVNVTIDDGTNRMLMTKPVFGGNANGVFVCKSDPQIATIRSKAMAPLEKDETRTGEVTNIVADLDMTSIRTEILGHVTEEVTGIKLSDAQVIVTGGRGIGSQQGFEQLEELANALNGAVGATRPACDNGWIQDNKQIGLTGQIVSPDLYIAVALSGSSQHMSGCSGSKVIVAINKDAEADIFNVAHYGIIADWKIALPAFTAKVKEIVNTAE